MQLTAATNNDPKMNYPPLLAINNLCVSFNTREGRVTAVNDLSFNLKPQETLGIVGESGSGKSQTAFALLGLLAANGQATGSAKFNGQEILNLPEKQLNKLRAEAISIIFQDPMSSLNPYLTVGEQLTEILCSHKKLSYRDAFQASIEMLDAVKIPAARQRMRVYPHQCSGGMRQRIMIAMALLCRPQLLIADEPTTALDVTVQTQILALLNELKVEFNTAIILITHDLGVIASSCDNMLVMYAGRTMEYGVMEAIFTQPSHPYTQDLLRAIPRLENQTQRLMTIPGNPPNMLTLPTGCAFQERCRYALPQCHTQPLLQAYGLARLRACHRPVEELQ